MNPKDTLLRNIPVTYLQQIGSGCVRAGQKTVDSGGIVYAAGIALPIGRKEVY